MIALAANKADTTRIRIEIDISSFPSARFTFSHSIVIASTGKAHCKRAHSIALIEPRLTSVDCSDERALISRTSRLRLTAPSPPKKPTLNNFIPV